MADDNSTTDAESPADRQHSFTELSELLIKGSAVLAIAGFLFTQARTAIDQGGGEEAILLVLPVDHFIEESSRFASAVCEGLTEAAAGNLVTSGDGRAVRAHLFGRYGGSRRVGGGCEPSASWSGCFLGTGDGERGASEACVRGRAAP